MTDTAINALAVQLEHLLGAEPGLQQALNPPQDTAQVVSLLADAAQRHGLPLDTALLPQAIAGVRQVGQLVQADPALQQALAAAPSAEQAAQLIQRAAQRHGPKDGAAVRELADADIEPAVGGFVAVSVLGVGAFPMISPVMFTIAGQAVPYVFRPPSRQPRQ